MSKRTALVFGGSGGIGRAICRRLAEDGFDIGLTYHTHPNAAAETSRQVEILGLRAHSVQATGENFASVAAAVESTVATLGGLDAVVYAAGPYLAQLHISKLGPMEFDLQMRQDASACYALAHFTIEQLRQSKGCFIAISTPAVRRHAIKDILSSAPKAAIETIIRGLAVEEGRFGVRANCIGVGLIEGGMHHALVERADFTPELLQYARQSLPLRRFGDVVDIAEAVGFLASAKARWITGQTLNVDGGYSIG